MTEGVHMNFIFLRSLHGIIKLKEMILAFVVCFLIGLVCVDSDDYRDTECYSISAYYAVNKYEWQGLVLAVLATTLITNFLQLLLHFFNLNKVWSNVNWSKGEMIYAMICFVLFFICMVLETYFAIDFNVYVRWIVAAAVGWMICVLFAVEVYLFYSGKIE